MKIRTSVILLVIVAMLLTACHPRILFEETISLPLHSWNQDDFLAYTISVEDTVDQYQISLIIRNDGRYEYSNLFLFINTTSPGGEGIRDTVEIRLADEKGNWYGKGIGGKYTLQVPFKKGVRFPQEGNYTIEIEQGMRTVDLEFITDVGLRVTKLK